MDETKSGFRILDCIFKRNVLGFPALDAGLHFLLVDTGTVDLRKSVSCKLPIAKDVHIPGVDRSLNRAHLAPAYPVSQSAAHREHMRPVVAGHNER